MGVREKESPQSALFNLAVLDAKPFVTWHILNSPHLELPFPHLLSFVLVNDFFKEGMISIEIYCSGKRSAHNLRKK